MLLPLTIVAARPSTHHAPKLDQQTDSTKYLLIGAAYIFNMSDLTKRFANLAISANENERNGIRRCQRPVVVKQKQKSTSTTATPTTTTVATMQQPDHIPQL